MRTTQPTDPRTPLADALTLKPWKIGVPFFAGIDLHQLAAATELSQHLGALRGGTSESPIFTCADEGPVESRQGVRLQTDATYALCPQLDVLIVAGDLPEEAPDLLRFVRVQAPGLRALIPVGTGRRVLEAAGCEERWLAEEFWK